MSFLLRGWSILALCFTCFSAQAFASHPPTSEVKGVLEDLWQEIQRAHPARQGLTHIPGTDVRVILGRIIPDIDKYFQVLIDNLNSIEIEQGNGKMIITVDLATEALTYWVADRHKTKLGRPYAVKLHQRWRFEAFMRKDSIIIGGIDGVTLKVKLPIISDSIHPRKIMLDTSREKLSIWAEAVGGAVGLVATADVRGRSFDGIDWWKTLLRNIPVFGGRMVYKIFR